MTYRKRFAGHAFSLLTALLALSVVNVSAQADTAFINLTSTAQTVRGFGGASVWLGALTDTEMNALFGNGNSNQIGLSIVRVRIAPEGSSRWASELSNAQKAIARGAIVIASPWSPPASMKTNNNIVGGSLKPTSYAAYAAHLKSFVDYMAAGGVTLYGISVQNEPDIRVSYESCDWTVAQMVDFLKNHGAAIGGTRLIAAESFNFNKTVTDPNLNDAPAAARVYIIGGHIYGAGLADYPLARSKGKEVWMTEHLENNTDWAGALRTGKEIHDSMTVGNFSAYLWWYLKRSYGPINDSGAVTKRGYVMGQFAKYIRPGYVRANATYSPSANVFVSAYKGAKVVIVAINQGNSAVNQTFNVQNGSVPSVTAIRTSSSQNLANVGTITLSSGSFTTTLPAQSITTFVQN